MMKLQVTLNGVRDDGYTKRGETVRTERYLADVYLQGSGALVIPITRPVYEALLNVKPGADALLPFAVKQEPGTRTANGRTFGVLDDRVRWGDLELVAASEPAKRAG